MEFSRLASLSTSVQREPELTITRLGFCQSRVMSGSGDPGPNLRNLRSIAEPSADQWDKAQRPVFCSTCACTAPTNPRLCRDCQEWDNAVHAFRCVRPLYSKTRHCRWRSIKDLCDTICILCQAIKCGVLECLGMREAFKSCGLQDLKIINGGPYHLDASGMIRKPGSSIDELQADDPSIAIRSVFLLVVGTDTDAHPDDYLVFQNLSGKLP